MSVHTLSNHHSRSRRHRFSRALKMESLETRQLMASDIRGTVFADDNRDGLKSSGEQGVAGWTVFLDANKDGNLNPGEVWRVTDKDGKYVFQGLPPGSTRVAQVAQPGWLATGPVSQDVNVSSGGTATADFFVFSGGNIEGTLFSDPGNDGNQDSTDPGLAGWTVFLDLDQSGAQDAGEPGQVTDAAGHYRFTELPPGDYEVTEVLPNTNWEPSKGHDIKQTAAVIRGQTFTQDFGNFSLTEGSIHGVVFNDVNANGIHDIDSSGAFVEPGLSGWTLFLDSNSNQQLDAGELSVLSDADGQYAFASLSAGAYQVTEVLPDGWSVTDAGNPWQVVNVSASEVSIADDFANFTVQNGAISGTMWNDVNRNGARDFTSSTGTYLDPALSGWTVYLDLNRSLTFDAGEPQVLTDADGNYNFPDLQVGEYTVREVIQAGWETSIGHDDNYTLSVNSGVTTLAPDFANFDSTGSGVASLSGSVWDDLNSNGVFEASEVGLGGRLVFIDSNSNGVLDSTERQVTTATDGTYALDNLLSGTINLVVSGMAGWQPTSPPTGARSVTVRGGVNLAGIDFGQRRLLDSSISGSIYIDKDNSGSRTAGDRGLPGVVVFLDVNDNGLLDAGEPQTTTSADLFYTPGQDEAGDYSFTHLSNGRYVVRAIVPETLSATPSTELSHVVTIASADNRTGVDTRAVYRPNEIHGVKFEDVNGNHVRDAGEPGMAGVTIFIDLNRDTVLNADEPKTITAGDGSYAFTGVPSGAYVLREVAPAGHKTTAPDTVGGILWPTGTSNAAVGNVSPTDITTSLKKDESYRTTVSLTLPNNNSLTSLVDVFLLFDDTGSFTNNSPIVRAAFPDIITRLQSSLPGIDLGFGVGRMEEYANFAFEYSTGRPFTLNQPIVAASTSGYMTAIQAALSRETPGYGGDTPETDIEALYQLVTGKGFDGNNNGSVLDSGPAGLASTQVTPGDSGDVPSFASFRADPTNSVLPAAGTIGGAGFRSGALPIVLLATDTGFAYQPKGEASITGSGGLTVPLANLTQTSRPETPYNSGAGIQETVTALNALGALVIGLGTNADATSDPRQQLESLSSLTGAVNRSITTIDNGTIDAIAPGDPLYFEIASGFSTSVANGVVNAIQNAVRNVAVDIDVIASDPRVKIINHTGVIHGVTGGQTSSFDIELVGDGAPHRFDLQFVRAGTNVVLGSIPVVLGTPIPGDNYEYDDIEDGEIEVEDNFGSQATVTQVINQAPSFIAGANVVVSEDASPQTITAWATSISPGPASESGQLVDFLVTTDNSALFTALPSITPDGTLSYTAAANAFGTAIVTVRLHDDGGTLGGGSDTSDPQVFSISITPVNDPPVATTDSYVASEDVVLSVAASAGVLLNDTDIDSSTLSAVLVSGPAHGTLVLDANGSFTYTPAANYFGPDSFTYQVSDGAALSEPATVYFDIAAVNDVPVAQNNNYPATSGVTLTIAAPGVLGNDTDIDGDALTSAVVTSPAHGTLALQPDGSFTYTSIAGYSGADTFTYIAKDATSSSLPATVTIQVQSVISTPKFFVVDGGTRSKFGYDANGVSTGETPLNRTDAGSRGIATSKDSSTTWVIDKDSKVFVYSSSGRLLGSWKAIGIDKPEGITTDDSNIWIVDRESDRVYFFAGAATRKSGSLNATSSFALNSRNQNPMDIVSDGSHLWVVNDTGADQIFRYSTSGTLQGNWQLDRRNTSPTGLTIDPNNINHIWVVDSGTDSIYQYNSAATRISGRQDASAVFPLAVRNTYPQGISDPLPTPSWNNFAQPTDVNNDGQVTPLDVLTVINRLNTEDNSELPERELGLPFWDVNDDGFVTARDALEVINLLNSSASDPASHDSALAAWFSDDEDEDNEEEDLMN